MNGNFIEIGCAGWRIRYKLCYPGTRYYFSKNNKIEWSDTAVYTTYEEIHSFRSRLAEKTRDEYVEFLCLIPVTSLELLKYDCCIYHAVSILFRGKAYLFTAPSGVGKTTQYLNWQRLFPGEIEMICGDKPALEAREDGSVWVWPSPWNGKERIRGTKAAPLAGIVLLEQGQENSIVPLSPSEALIPLFEQFLVAPETEAQIKSLACLSDQMLRSAKLYKLTNLGDDASTRLLRNTLLAAAEEENGNADV